MPRKVEIDLKDGWLLVLVAICFLLNLGGYPLFDLDEGAFSAASWEMLQRHDFITTYLNGVPRFDKPILVYWFQAASLYTFGATEWAVRLPSAIFASLWVSAVYYFVKPRWSSAQAQVTAIILATSFAVLAIGRAATADALLNLLITATMLDIWRYYERYTDSGHAAGSNAIVYRVYLWMGLGFLCKGPVAIMIPLVVSAVFFMLRGGFKAWLLAIINPVGIALFILIAAPWYVLEYHAQGMDFVNGFFFKHNLNRFGDTMEGHGGKLWYYLAFMPVICLPYCLYWLRLLINPLRTASNNAEGNRRSLYQYAPSVKMPNLRLSLVLYFWIWFGFVFGFFSISSTQLPHYVLYGYTPIAIMLALQAGEQPGRWWLFFPIAVSLAALAYLPLGLGLWATEHPSAFNGLMLARAQTLFAPPYPYIIAAVFAALVLTLFVPNRWARLRFAVQALLMAGSLIFVVAPRIALVQQSGVKAAAQFAKTHLTGKRIVTSGIDMPSFTFYRQAVTPKIDPAVGEIVFTKATNPALAPTTEKGQYQILFSQGGIVLAQRLR